MKKEKLQLTPQKYKLSFKTTTSNYMPIRWITQKKMDKTEPKEIENMNRLTTSNDIKTMMKNIPKNESPGHDAFTGKFYKTFREELTLIFL